MAGENHGGTLLGVVAALSAILLVSGCRIEGASQLQARPAAPGPEAIKRGEYLFDAANCVGCHTDGGGARLAGGRAVLTPFGAYYSRNITPDPVYGIGAWSDEDFVQALRRGTSPAGAHYFPAFPFPAFTGMTDQDILDIKAYLFAQAPVAAPNKPHAVGFPFDMRISVILWRALYFSPGPMAADPGRTPEWNRGAYLANAVAHCGECHTPRTALGGLETERAFSGGELYGPGAKLAPNITPDPVEGIGDWSLDEIDRLLERGMTAKGDFVGMPMAEVVDGTAKLTAADRHAIAIYLKSLRPIPGKGS